MKRNVSLAAMLALLMGLLVVVPMRAEAAVTVPITGTAQRGLRFIGNLTVTDFQVVDEELVAIGTVTGQLVTRTGQIVTQVFNLPVTIPVFDILPGGFNDLGECTVLDLTLGPLDLTLLGLRVQLNQVHLLITADPAGGILGALLCSLAGGFPGLTLAELLQLADLLGDLI